MFDVFCSACNTRQLISSARVTGIVNAPRGIAVQYRCTCGELGIMITGRKHTEAAA